MMHRIEIQLNYIEHLSDVSEWLSQNVGHSNYTLDKLFKGVTKENGRPEIMFTYMSIYIEDTAKAATTKLRWG